MTANHYQAVIRYLRTCRSSFSSFCFALQLYTNKPIMIGVWEWNAKGMLPDWKCSARGVHVICVSAGEVLVSMRRACQQERCLSAGEMPRVLAFI